MKGGRKEKREGRGGHVNAGTIFCGKTVLRMADQSSNSSVIVLINLTSPFEHEFELLCMVSL